MLLNYPFDRMAQGALDMVTANQQVTDLQGQFQTAMQQLLAAWSSQQGSPELQEVQRLWVQANEEINLVLRGRGDAMDESWIGMKRADVRAADAVRSC
ncbi:hypothetical protein ACWF0M_14345 [Kribbella sp. NPDC055110]